MKPDREPPLFGTVLVWLRFILAIKIKFCYCGGETAVLKGPCCFLDTSLGKTCKRKLFKFDASDVNSGNFGKCKKKKSELE